MSWVGTVVGSLGLISMLIVIDEIDLGRSIQNDRCVGGFTNVLIVPDTAHLPKSTRSGRELVCRYRRA